MSKDFEKAYRKLAQSECPDLWDRIEAGLIEKSAPGKQEAETDFQVLVQKDICQEEKPQSKEAQGMAEKAQKEADKKSSRRAILKTYGGVAAAVVCAAAIIPAFLNISSTKSGSVEEIQENAFDSAAPGSAAAMDAGAAEAEDMPPMESGAEPEEGASDREQKAPAAGGAGMEKAAITEEADKKSTLTEDKTADVGDAQDSGASKGAAQQQGAEQQKIREEKENAQDGRQDFGVNAAGAMAESQEEDRGDWIDDQASEEEKSKKPDDGVVFQLIVEVAQADEIYQGQTPMGTLYTVVIQEDKAGFFKEGEQIEIYAPVDSSQALIKDGVFDVDIVYRQEEDHPYILQLCRREYVGNPNSSNT